MVTTTDLSVKQLSPALGAEISGIEISGTEFGSDAELRNAINNGEEINFKFTLS